MIGRGTCNLRDRFFLRREDDRGLSWCANTSPFYLLCYDQMMVSAPYRSGQTSTASTTIKSKSCQYISSMQYNFGLTVEERWIPIIYHHYHDNNQPLKRVH